MTQVPIANTQPCTACCHDHVEHVDRPGAMRDGWLIPKLSDDHPSTVPLLTYRGWVLLDDAGGRVPYIQAVS